MHFRSLAVWESLYWKTEELGKFINDYSATPDDGLTVKPIYDSTDSDK